MIQRTLLLMVVFLALSPAVKSLNSIDDHIRDHCGDACNGESDDCRVCYNEAVDLHDQAHPDSPEVNWDIHSNHGKLELVF